MESNNEANETNIIQEETTNCLALMVIKDYKAVAIKNMINKGIGLSWKVVLSMFAMNFLNLFL